MSRFKHCFVVAALLVSASACMSESDGESVTSDEQELSRTVDSPQLVQNWHVAIENAKFDKVSGNISPTAGNITLAVDCAFIEWCNRPSSIKEDVGTVCRIRTGCSLSSATVNECTNDAIAVCGGITQKAVICQQGASCCPAGSNC